MVVLLTLGVELLLDSLERVVNLFVVKLVSVLRAVVAEDRRDEGLLLLVEDHTVVGEELEEDGLAQAGEGDLLVLQPREFLRSVDASDADALSSLSASLLR